MYQKQENTRNPQEKSKLVRFGFPASATLIFFNLFAEYGTDALALFIEPKEPNRTAALIMENLVDLESGINTDSYEYFLTQQKYPTRNYVADGVSAYGQLFNFFNRFSNGNERLDYVKFMNEIGGVDENNNPTAESRTAGAIFIYNEFVKEGYEVPPPEYMLALCGIESNWRHFSAPGVLVQGDNGGSIDWGFCQINDYWHKDKMELAKSDNWLDNLYAAYLVVIDHNAWNPTLPSEEERLRYLAIKYRKPASNDLYHQYPELAWARFQDKNTWWDPYYQALLDKIKSGEKITSRGLWYPPVIEGAGVSFGYGKETSYTVDGAYWHNAVDFNYPGCEGDPVFATQNGIVEKTSLTGLGNNVAILSWQENGYEFRATYGHLQEVTKVGAVMAGDQIGKIGRDGFGVDASGKQIPGGVPHLHFRVEVKNSDDKWVAFNPCNYFDQTVYGTNQWMKNCTVADNIHVSPLDDPAYFGIGKEDYDDGDYVIEKNSNSENTFFDQTFSSMAYDGIGGAYAYNEVLPFLNYESRTGQNYIIIHPGETFSFNNEFAKDVGGQADQFIRGYLDYIQPSTGNVIPGGGVCDTAQKICTAALASGLEVSKTNIDGYGNAGHPIGPGVDPACDVTIWIDYASQGGTNRRDLEISNPLSYPIKISWEVIDVEFGKYRIWTEKLLDSGLIAPNSNDDFLAVFDMTKDFRPLMLGWQYQAYQERMATQV